MPFINRLNTTIQSLDSPNAARTGSMVLSIQPPTPTMKTKSILLLAAALLTLPALSSAQELHRREVNEKAAAGGKDLIMKLEELRRDAKTSEIKVIHTSGASVPSSMFIMRGCYDIAVARQAAFFIKLKEWKADDGTTHMLLGFSNDENMDPKTFFDLKEPLSEEAEFMVVEDLKVMFGGK